MKTLIASIAIATTAVLAGHTLAARRSLAPGTHVVAVRHDGRLRTAIVIVPPQAGRGKPLPLVVNFHGGGSNAAGEESFTGMDTIANRAGFLVVYPNGTGFLPNRLLTWNAGACCGYAAANDVDDVGSTLALLDKIERLTSVDPRRVYATGMSNGAMMAYRMAVDASARIAAIAPVSGGMVVTSFHPSRPVAVMHFHSVDDPRAPYAGGLGPPFPGTNHRETHPSIQAVIDDWVAVDGCPTTPHTGRTIVGSGSDAGETATRIGYGPCRAGTDVVLWKLTGSGHVWPGGKQDVNQALLGRPTSIIEASTLMWRFFQRHPLPR
ncbi:MAG TPA: PHB depolymerase family esterase [Mycobacteriales bacterium]|nr:PHB depolymerase family esterase [Mycobacteriales bacterium]